MANRAPNAPQIAEDIGKSACVPSYTHTSRRAFLKTLAIAGASAAFPASGLLAQATSGGRKVEPGRIDVHHHLYPPAYMKAVGYTPSKRWTPQTSLDMMDRAGVATAILSAVQGMVKDSMSGKDQKARDLVRMNNEFGALVMRDHPMRFGFFAALPLPDPDGSLKEIAYAFDTLKADGIGLWTSYMDKWVGDPVFWPAFEELNRRSAVVFYHPAHNTCCRDIPGQSGIIDFDLDTTRAIDSMLFQGTLSKFPNIHHIWSHAGGAFSVLAARIEDDFPKNRADKVPNGVAFEIKKLYFDTAHASKAPVLDALHDIVPVSQILYGSDAPIREFPLTDVGLDEYPRFSENDWKVINRGNAERLFPRLKA